MVGRKREAHLRPDIPAIHIFVLSEVKDADARHKAGHDAESWALGMTRSASFLGLAGVLHRVERLELDIV